MKTVAIVGLGNFGFALLKHFDVKNNNCSYILKGYDRNQKVINFLNTKREHPFLYKYAKISTNVMLDYNIKTVVKGADFIILAVSSNAIPEVLQKIKSHIKNYCVFINTAKALDYKTGKRFSEITKEIFGNKKITYAQLAGGTIAADLFKSEPLGVDIACVDKKALKNLEHIFNSYNLTVYTTSDIAGVEYAAAFKNVISILAGIIKGMGFSYGSETYIISRAASEVEELVKGLGGKSSTFSMQSQSWGNDLWMSCTGNTRNKEFGILIGKGYSISQALSIMNKKRKTVEGIYTIKVLDTFKDIKKYHLLYFLYQLFHRKKKLNDIKELIFNEKL